MTDAAADTVIVRGQGPGVLLIHGTCADARAWSIQLATLSKQFRLCAYDRPGTGKRPLPGQERGSDLGWLRMEEYAQDAAQQAAATFGGEPVVVVGSSFGALVGLELARRSPDRVAGLVMCEPPCSPSDYRSAVPIGFGCTFEALVQCDGPMAAEYFLRTVLGEADFAAIPKSWRRPLLNTWPQIITDSRALAHYRVDYPALEAFQTPVLLLGGAESSRFYSNALAALYEALPNARLEYIEGAGHMMHADAYRSFNKLVGEFAQEHLPSKT